MESLGERGRGDGQEVGGVKHAGHGGSRTVVFTVRAVEGLYLPKQRTDKIRGAFLKGRFQRNCTKHVRVNEGRLLRQLIQNFKK